MKHTIRVLLLVLTVGLGWYLVFGHSGTDAAQSAATPQAAPAPQAPNTQPASKAQPVPANQKGAKPRAETLGGGAPDEGFDEQPGDPSAPPTPANPVQKVMEGGKIQMLVGSPRHFGNRIGDVVPIRVLILTDNSVTLDFTSLKQGVLGFNGSEFELAHDDPITVRSRQVQGNKTLYIIDLRLQTFVIREPGVIFNLDLRYATERVGDSQQPNWKVLTTPDFFVTRSNTADNGNELLEGDLDARSGASPWLMWPLLVTGFFLVGLWPGYLLVSWLNRIRPGYRAPAHVVAWKKFTKALKDADEFGFGPRHYKQIASALRVYLGVEPHTVLEVGDRLHEHPQLATITSALSKCERVLYGGATLSDEENEELVRELEELVPRPQ